MLYPITKIQLIMKFSYQLHKKNQSILPRLELWVLYVWKIATIPYIIYLRSYHTIQTYKHTLASSLELLTFSHSNFTILCTFTSPSILCSEPYSIHSDPLTLICCKTCNATWALGISSSNGSVKDKMIYSNYRQASLLR